jgi:nitrogen PTS system EIIA component
VNISDIITPKSIIPALKVKSKKKLMQLMSEKASELTNIDAREIFETITHRETLGSTGIGNGIAIPHGKLTNVKSIFGIFARLEAPIDFDALDDRPVDLVFLLLAPALSGSEHLKALSRIARIFREDSMVQTIRGTKDAGALFAILTDF